MADLTDALLATGAGGTGVALVVAAMKFVDAWLSRRRTPEQRLGDAAGAASELIKLAMEASGTSVQQLLEEIRDLRSEQEKDRREIAALRTEVEACHGREAQTNQLNRSLIAVLRRQGIDLPAEAGLPGAFYELNGDEVVALAPVRGLKTEEDGR